jgi:putative ABC transport system permease protein
MIFGVAAVVAMLSIGAGAQQEVMAFIEQLGVRNLIVEAREAPDNQALQKVRKLSPGLTSRTPRHPGERRRHQRRERAQAVHAVEAAAEAAAATADRLRRQPAYATDRQPAVASGRFFDERETSAAAPVAVLGEGAAARSSAPTIRSAATSR